ncbi:hypothetical protein [Crocosphaera sp.]|uniref:hypothetical protein n=1 Tax=Crocosphaera sp. TaxID=2729996 RepID=UPI003F1F1408|nr:hypothetical protein [Crocosphaera sp.]
MKTSLKVILIAALWILIVSTGRMGTIDTVLRLQMAHSWWSGQPEIKPNYQPSHGHDIKAGIQTLNGDRRYGYDSGQSLLMLPSDWLSTKVKPYFPKIGRRDFQELGVSFLTFLPINVATVVACFWLLRLFGFEKNLAGLSSIIWLITTTVWHYSQVPFHNNLVNDCNAKYGYYSPNCFSFYAFLLRV